MTRASVDASLSIVVPVYNAAGSLDALAERVASALGDREYELVLVNDDSADESWELIEALVVRDPRIRGVNMMRNYGQHNATLAGIRAAQNDVIVTIDDDLQHPPEEIPKVIAQLDEGYDVVYGTPVARQFGVMRNIVTALAKMALRYAMGIRDAEMVSPFRAFRSDLRPSFVDFQGPYVSIDVLLSWSTTRFGSVAVRHDERAGGRSNYTLRKLASYALTMLTGFTTRPLRFAILLGIVVTFFGLVLLAYVLVRYFAYGSPVPGFSFLASALAIFSGAQLLTLGIIGEYLARVHVRMMDRPTYTIRNEVGHRQDLASRADQDHQAAADRWQEIRLGDQASLDVGNRLEPLE
jgi:glycosyltransferase involved in cell wall biosynthesis